VVGLLGVWDPSEIGAFVSLLLLLLVLLLLVL
jgi:hypothetical protein